MTAPLAQGATWEATAAPIVLAAWLAGAILTAASLMRRQAAFLRDADLGLAGPAIVGFSHPRIVTPDDFTRRFSDSERKLILTHEQVHLERNDARINALIALVRCLFWFNPLVHVGARTLRIDQELSCDAEVIDRRPRVRRAYAETRLNCRASGPCRLHTIKSGGLGVTNPCDPKGSEQRCNEFPTSKGGPSGPPIFFGRYLNCCFPHSASKRREAQSKKSRPDLMSQQPSPTPEPYQFEFVPAPADLRFDANIGGAPVLLMGFADRGDLCDGAVDDAQPVIAQEKPDFVARGELQLGAMTG